LYGVLLVGLFAQNETLSRVAFCGIIALLGALALLEFFNMAEKRSLAPFKLMGIGAGVGLILAVFWSLAILRNPGLAVDIEFATVICLVPILGICQLFAPKSKGSIAPMASTLFGIIYVALLLNVLQMIRYFDDEGHWWLLYFIVVSKMSDTGAYCVGSLIGKHKMIPREPGQNLGRLRGWHCLFHPFQLGIFFFRQLTFCRDDIRVGHCIGRSFRRGFGARRPN
jgi:phosphatidate cytidylyltransferase